MKKGLSSLRAKFERATPLGDGMFVQRDGDNLVVTTEQTLPAGEVETSRIVLSPKRQAELSKWVREEQQRQEALPPVIIAGVELRPIGIDITLVTDDETRFRIRPSQWEKLARFVGVRAARSWELTPVGLTGVRWRRLASDVVNPEPNASSWVDTARTTRTSAT
jgi:hypothetical protein